MRFELKFSGVFCVDFSFIVGYTVVSRPFLNLNDDRMANLSAAERMEVQFFLSLQIPAALNYF